MQALACHAKAHAYIIENKLMDIQKHMVKILVLEDMVHNLRQYLKDYNIAYVSDAFGK